MGVSSLPPRIIMQQVCKKHVVDLNDVLARSRKKDLDRARTEIYVRLRDEKGMSFGAISNLTKRSKPTIKEAYDTHHARRALGKQPNDILQEIDAQERRRREATLAYEIAGYLNVQMGQAIFLAVLAEAFPRVMTLDQFCESYDAINDVIYVGSDRMITLESVKVQTANCRRHFNKLGLPDPIRRILPGGIVLSDEVSVWFNARFGYPVRTRRTNILAGVA